MIQNTLYQHAIWNLEPLFHWFIIIYYVWNASGNFEKILNGNGIFHKINMGNGIRPPPPPSPSGPSYTACKLAAAIEHYRVLNGL